MIPEINYLAVIVAAVVGMAAGALWYSPVLFGNLWMRLSGMSEEKMKEAKAKGMATAYILSFLGTFLVSFAVATVLGYAGAGSLWEGVSIAFLLWLGFAAPVLLNSVLWEGKSVGLYLLNIGHYLIVLLLMAGILVFWG